MIEPPGGPTVLIVDEDVGFVWWLGEIFGEFGYRSIPGLGCREALSLLRTSARKVDLLVINPQLRGAGHFIKILTRLQAAKIVLIAEADEAETPHPTEMATLHRPSGWGPVSRVEWRQKIQRLLTQLGNRAAS